MPVAGGVGAEARAPIQLVGVVRVVRLGVLDAVALRHHRPNHRRELVVRDRRVFGDALHLAVQSQNRRLADPKMEVRGVPLDHRSQERIERGSRLGASLEGVNGVEHGVVGLLAHRRSRSVRRAGGDGGGRWGDGRRSWSHAAVGVGCRCRRRLFGGRVMGLGLLQRPLCLGRCVDARLDPPSAILHHGANAKRAVVGGAVEGDHAAGIELRVLLGIGRLLEQHRDLGPRERRPSDGAQSARDLELRYVAVGEEQQVGAIAHQRREKSIELRHQLRSRAWATARRLSRVSFVVSYSTRKRPW
jgi:hypothetical protein